MDLYVERQCIDKMKDGELRQFLNLFEANFEDLYKYIIRRTNNAGDSEAIVRLSLLDALGQVQNTPMDSTYLVWLFSLAKPRVHEYIEKEKVFNEPGIITGVREGSLDEQQKAEITKLARMMNKLSLEEREILRLKFFEQVSDGDVMTILGLEEGKVGAHIYRVLKRAHFLLFGESDERQGVYFGELSGFFERIRELEDIKPPEVLKMSLKEEFSTRIKSKDFAINGEIVKEEKVQAETAPPKAPFERVDQKAASAKGSNDPAKIFTEAVREMKKEEEMAKKRERLQFEKKERVFDFVDKYKALLTFIPVLLFAGVFMFVALKLWILNGKVERGYPTVCSIAIEYQGEFSDGLKRGVNRNIADPLCEYYEESYLLISKVDEETISIEIETENGAFSYVFFKRAKNSWWIRSWLNKSAIALLDNGAKQSLTNS